jgi:GTP cyclohydrolase I
MNAIESATEEQLIYELLNRIKGEDPRREGLQETPLRVVKAWREMTSGYEQKPADILSKTFESTNGEMVVCRDIEFYSTCEHHLLPFKGRAHIGYVPKGRVAGLSKLARLVECFARRLQIQEQLTEQIAGAIMEHLQPCGCAVILEAEHLCMKSRGVRNHSSVMVTSALRGVFLEPEVRAEFFVLVRGMR